MSDVFEAAALDFEQAAGELERAAAHLRTTARHFRDQEVPRACAHAFSAEGHVANAQELIRKRAVMHAAKSNP